MFSIILHEIICLFTSKKEEDKKIIYDETNLYKFKAFINSN